MVPNAPHAPKICMLAARIEDDIRGGGFQPGDAYRGTNEVARMLGVSTVAANRAMQLLVKRQLVTRRQRKGAIIAAGLVQACSPPLSRVQFLVHRNYLRTEGLLADGVMIGMQADLPGVDVQLNFLPPNAGHERSNRTISSVLRSPEPEGFVLVRSSLTMQRMIQASGLPAVVHGSLHPSVHGLPWIDCDHRRSAQLLTQYLVDRDCQRIVYLSRDVIFPGDHPFQDGISETMATAGRALAPLITRCLPADVVAIKAAVSELLAPGGGPVGIIARSERLAEGAAAAAEAKGLRIGSDAMVVVSHVFRAGNENPVAFPYIRNMLEPQQIGAHLARMLVRLVKNQPVEPDHEIIPGELKLPTEGNLTA